jgi:hypothetical protein
LDDDAVFTRIGRLGVYSDGTGASVFYENVDESKIGNKQAALTAMGDIRTLDMLAPNGRRHRGLGDTLALLSREPIPDFSVHFAGPPATLEYLTSVDLAGGFVAFESKWARDSGVPEGSAAAHQHRTGSETLRLSIKVDQLAATHLVSVENLARRQIQVEVAVKRDPEKPDFSGLSEVMGGASSEGGAAQTRLFTS